MKKSKELIASQWQTYVESANQLSTRRDQLNNLYVTLNIALITALTIVFDVKSIVLAVAGLTLCIIWIFQLNNYKKVLAIKFEIIDELENNLPEQPFKNEWKKLQSKRGYTSGTSLEIITPSVFAIIYIVIFLMGIHM